MQGDFRFIADASLAGLAKWLRLLGFDTVVYSQTPGRSMLRCALAERRIVLTRRRDMINRQFSGRMELLSDVEVPQQLHFIIQKLSLRIEAEKMYTLCLVCNERLNPLDRELVCDLVPEYVLKTCSQFNQCPKCGKIYWPGTHPRNALRFLKDHGIPCPDLT